MPRPTRTVALGLLASSALACVSAAQPRVAPAHGREPHAHAPTMVLEVPSRQLRARLTYEQLPLREDLGGLEAPRRVPARGVAFRVHAGDAVLAEGATGESGDDAGRLRVALPRELPRGAVVTFTTARLDDPAGLPGLAVAHGAPTAEPDVGRDDRAGALWSWSFPVTSAGDLGDLAVTVEQGSGAIQALQYMLANRALAARTFAGPGPAYEVVPSLAVVWEPGMRFPCGTCYFENSAAGPLRVEQPGAPLLFETYIWLDGTEATHGVWTPTLLHHELGHWAMDAFAVIPHYETDDERAINERERATIAWAEGWATWWGQRVQSAQAGAARSAVIYQDDYEYYRLDVATGAFAFPTRPYARLAPAEPRRGLSQSLADGLVTTILWQLRDVLGDDAMAAALTSPRMTGSLDRGGAGLDLVDFLDAVLCADAVHHDAVVALVRGRFRFPYDARPLCARRGG